MKPAASTIDIAYAALAAMKKDGSDYRILDRFGR